MNQVYRQRLIGGGIFVASWIVCAVLLQGFAGGFINADEFKTYKPENICQFADCPRPAAEKETIHLKTGQKRVSQSQTVLYYDDLTFNLCRDHAVCARRERWPLTGERALWLILLSGLVGLLPAGLLVLAGKKIGLIPEPYD